MPNRIEITGNLGAAPTLRHVDTANGRRQVTQFSVMADDYRRLPNGELEQVGGFWARVSVWEPHAERVNRLLSKGVRVHVVGTMRLNVWEDDHNERQTGIDITADGVFLHLGRVETVTYRRREGASDGGAPPPNDPPADYEPSTDDL
ncbi:single-stranded DNA-binding protein [Burkholderia glumae]|uniref:single-stranded DNA-binding protein n=1 Tax=Burkholderia glumae TaxID=337 RepID=UPI0020CD434E|nr:single-stranded DNA-binding protein [Burkholderia glumae]MCQ0031457.1 single-stranded DNA-binding protein [Burkholderia glumae]MCQ0035109.1 single-stranded DNA-binding protein [Burkholderia glumae]UVT00108.1 single-stranded DNA-binding protein [Burkholderia glumae]